MPQRQYENQKNGRNNGETIDNKRQKVSVKLTLILFVYKYVLSANTQFTQNNEMETHDLYQDRFVNPQ